MAHSIPFCDPKKFIAFLDKAEQTNALNDYTSIALTDEERQALKLFLICWHDGHYHSQKSNHKLKLKARLTLAQRRRIHQSLKVVLQLAVLADNNTAVRDKAHSRSDPLELLLKTEEAIQQYATLRQRIAQSIGKWFAMIYAVANGINNSRALAQAIVLVAVILGATGVTLATPAIIAIACAAGVMGFIVNATLAYQPSADNFSLFFGEGKPFSGLFDYKDKEGNRMRFSNRQAYAFLAFGALPAIFSALCKGILAGYIIFMMLGSFPLALPIAILTVISCTAALSIVYVKNTCALFHFDKSQAGWSAVKRYLKRFIYPRDVIDEMTETHITLIKQQLPDDMEVQQKYSDELQRYQKRIKQWSKRLSFVFIPIAVLGIVLTLYASAVVAPVLIPILTMGAGLVIAALALPGQVPLYTISSAICATKIAVAACPVPKELKQAITQNTHNKEKPSLTAREQEVLNRKSSLGLLTQILNRIKNGIFEFSKFGNSFGSGAITAASADYFHPLLNLILKPITLLIAAFSSAMMGFALKTDAYSPTLGADARYQQALDPNSIGVIMEERGYEFNNSIYSQQSENPDTATATPSSVSGDYSPTSQ